MKPQPLFEQIIDIEECHEACPELFFYEGTTVIELPGIPVGREVLISFMPETGECQIEEPTDWSPDMPGPGRILGKFAMKLTLEPITE